MNGRGVITVPTDRLALASGAYPGTHEDWPLLRERVVLDSLLAAGVREPVADALTQRIEGIIQVCTEEPAQAGDMGTEDGLGACCAGGSK